jgi:transcriptional regulator with XRE-family HTH domain
MTDSTFGSRLASERIRRGLTLDQVSSTLRIRPAILESLERGDFGHMPLKGHARNMISSYARYLGLDAVELTEQFLREYHEFEASEARATSSARRTGITPNYHNPPEGEDSSQSASLRRQSSSTTRVQGTRSMWNRALPSTSDHQVFEKRQNSRASSRITTRSQGQGSGQGQGRSQSRDRAPSQGLGPGHSQSQGRAQTRNQGQGRGRVQETGRASGRSRRSGSRERDAWPSRTVSDNSYTPAGRGYGSAGGYAPAKGSLISRILGTLFKSPLTAIISLVVLLVLLLVLWALAANSCAKKTEDTVPPGEVAHTVDEAIDPDTGLEVPDLNDELLPDPRYGPFQLTIEAVAGTAPWTEVTVDGELVLAGLLDARMSWEVTDYCEISTGQPGNLRVTRNETAVELEISDSGVGEKRLEVEERPASSATTNTPQGDEAQEQGSGAAG